MGEMPLQRLIWYLQYLALRAAAASIGRLSWDRAQRLGERAGLLGARLVRRRWDLTVANLRRALPDEDPAAIEAYAREAWMNLGRVASELAWASRASKEEVMRRCPFENLDVLRRALQGGRGAIIHLGHFGNWELAGLSLPAHGLPITAVGRRIKNPYVDGWLKGMRSRFGLTLLGHKNPFFPIARAIKQGRGVGVLMDQSLPEGGVFVPFFGRPAATTTLTALLAMKLKAPIVPLDLRREGGIVIGRFEEPVAIEPGESEEALTARLTAIIERWARRSPGDWFWLHNRWKRSPEAERQGAARG